jgi:signal transduction histidine kinase
MVWSGEGVGVVAPGIVMRRQGEVVVAAGLAVVLVLLAAGLGVVYGWSGSLPVVPAFRPEADQLCVETVCFTVAGLIVATRSAGRMVGWILLFRGGCVLVALGLLASMARQAVTGPVSTVEFVVAALSIGGTNWTNMVLPLWLPDGRLPGRRSRRYVRGVVGTWAVLDAMLIISAYPDLYGVKNPLYGSIFGGLTPKFARWCTALMPFVVCGFVLVAVAVVAGKWRATSALQRRQIVVLAPIYLVWESQCVLWAVGGFDGWPRTALAYTLAVLWPATLAFVITRDQLWHLDLAARRGVVAAALLVALGGGYLAIVLTVTWRLPPVAFSVVAVLAVSAGWGLPALARRLSFVVDRIFYGYRAKPYVVIRSLGLRLRDRTAETDIPTVVCHTVASALRFPFVALDGLDRRLASAGTYQNGDAPMLATFVLGYQGRTVGQLLVQPRHGQDQLDAADTAILEPLAAQVAPVLANLDLVDQIQTQARELAASRTRIVHAQDSERRRIERRLHDGVQQELVAVVAKLRLARNQLRRGSDSAASTITEVQDDTNRIIDQLREVAQGIYPSVLSDLGLIAAVTTAARRVPIPVSVVSDDCLAGVHLALDIEESAFFLVSEALTNIMKHARAASATIHLTRTGQWLEITISDDGVGYTSIHHAGSGITGLHDRISAVGGTLDIASTPGRGTIVRTRLPARPREDRT